MTEMTFPQKIFLFFILTVFISPFQFHMDLYDPLRRSMSTGEEPFLEAVMRVFKSGPLFFFAATLGISIFFEVKDHYAFVNRPAVFWLKFFCFVPVFLLVIENFAVRFGYRVADKWFIGIQCGAALISLSVAMIAKSFIYKPKT